MKCRQFSESMKHFVACKESLSLTFNRTPIVCTFILIVLYFDIFLFFFSLSLFIRGFLYVPTPRSLLSFSVMVSTISDFSSQQEWNEWKKTEWNSRKKKKKQKWKKQQQGVTLRARAQVFQVVALKPLIYWYERMRNRNAAIVACFTISDLIRSAVVRERIMGNNSRKKRKMFEQYSYIKKKAKEEIERIKKQNRNDMIPKYMSTTDWYKIANDENFLVSCCFWFFSILVIKMSIKR